MKTSLFRMPFILCALVWLSACSTLFLSAQTPDRKTTVSIEGEKFLINGKPTYEGRTWREHNVEGLLMNSRMVQGIFDDLNMKTARRWAYADTGKWDSGRNTREFIEAMPIWHQHGLLCVVVNLQGGSPEGYSKEQPWHNSAIRKDGSLRPEYMRRLERIVERADELGMVIMLGIFYSLGLNTPKLASAWLFGRV